MILDRIVADCQLQLQAQKLSFPLAKLQRAALEQSPPLDFASALRGDGIRLIAEVKKASKYFQGSLDYLRDIKIALVDKNIPLLRKDFLFDSYQIYQSRAYGADSLLLIVSILTPEKLKELLELSHVMKMSCLVEVHNETELQTAIKSGARIIGINNRDLTTFTVDLGTTERLRPLIPPDRIVVSESGINTRSDVEKLKELGVDAVLIGETLMTASDIASKISELL
jgi:indole-3-glycerol phosphate synthase